MPIFTAWSAKRTACSMLDDVTHLTSETRRALQRGRTPYGRADSR